MAQAQTTSGLLPAYLVVGADDFKRHRAATRLKGRLNQDFSAFNLDERMASSDLDPADILSSLNTLPMGDSFRLVMIERADKLPKPVSEAIISYLADPNPACVLCLVAESLPKNTRLYKAVAKLGETAIVDCAPKKRWELPPLVVQMARTHGVSMDKAAAEELVSRVGESTTMIDSQLAVLAQYCRDRGAITLADVEQHITRTAEVKPWDFLDAVSQRDAVKALSLYRLMQNPSQIALCSLLTTRIRELICAQSLEARGQGGALARELGKQAWQVKNHRAWARNFPRGALEKDLLACARCEQELKSGTDPDISFTELVVSICR